MRNSVPLQIVTIHLWQLLFYPCWRSQTAVRGRWFPDVPWYSKRFVTVGSSQRRLSRMDQLPLGCSGSLALLCSISPQLDTQPVIGVKCLWAVSVAEVGCALHRGEGRATRFPLLRFCAQSRATPARSTQRSPITAKVNWRHVKVWTQVSAVTSTTATHPSLTPPSSACFFLFRIPHHSGSLLLLLLPSSAHWVRCSWRGVWNSTLVSHVL